MLLFQIHLFVKYKLTIGISSVCGINLTSYDTDWRQPCNTCIEAFFQTLLIISNFLKIIIFIQGLVRFYADYRIKQHASLRLLRDRLIFLFSILQSYSQGGMVNVLTLTLIFFSDYHSLLTERSTRVSNPDSYPILRSSASIFIGKMPSPLVFYRVYCRF